MLNDVAREFFHQNLKPSRCNSLILKSSLIIHISIKKQNLMAHYKYKYQTSKAFYASVLS